MTLRPQDVQVLVEAFEASGWDEMTLILAGETVQLSRTGRPPAHVVSRPDPGPVGGTAVEPPVAAAAVSSLSGASASGTAPPVTASTPDAAALHRITSPSVGVLWRAPEPSAPPFVEVGQRVEPGDPVCIVEVMKLFNHVQAGVAGTIRSIEVANGDMVEHGQTLFLVELEP